MSGSHWNMKLIKPFQKPSFDHQHFAVQPKNLLQIQIRFENIGWKCCYGVFKTSGFFQASASFIVQEGQQPCASGLQVYLENYPLSISEIWAVNALLRLCMAVWAKNSLKPAVIPIWRAEGCVHTYAEFLIFPNSQLNSQIPLSTTTSITCHKRSIMWENCRMWVLYPQSPSLQLLWLLLKSSCHMWQKTASGWLSPMGHWSESMMTVGIARQIQ